MIGAGHDVVWPLPWRPRRRWRRSSRRSSRTWMSGSGGCDWARRRGRWGTAGSGGGPGGGGPRGHGVAGRGGAGLRAASRWAARGGRAGAASGPPTRPGLRPALLALVEPDERAIRMSPLRWTTKSTRNAGGRADRGRGTGRRRHGGDLLREEGFSLQGNAKTIEGSAAPRPGRAVPLHQCAGQGPPGRRRPGDQRGRQEEGKRRRRSRTAGGNGGPRAARSRSTSTTSPDKELGKATPYGVYDVAANAGWVNVGTDHDTAAFAVESIRRWWQTAGQPAYPGAARLLISADGGGSNGYRTRLWKAELAALAAETGLEITVCHFPPGHLQVEQDRAPAVLPHHDELARPAADQPRGHRAHHRRDHDPHRADRQRRAGHRPPTPKASRSQTAQMKDLEQRVLRRHEFHGEWNYPSTHPCPHLIQRVIHLRALTPRPSLTASAALDDPPISLTCDRAADGRRHPDARTR